MFAKKALAASLSSTAEKVYVEDVFSTYLYTGNGSSQTIRNGIRLANGAENGTVLQLSGDSIADTSPVTKALTNTNSVTVNTSVKKYGTGSLDFNGTNNYLSTAASSAWDFGTGDFTIEFWVRFKGTSGSQTLLDINYGTSPNILIQPGFGVMYVFVNGTSVQLSVVVSGSTWYHFAVVRKSGTITLYQDGVSVSTATYTGNVGNSSATAYIGGSPGGGGYFLNGYLDDLRITNGTARYTANFTPPTAALPLDTLVEGQGGMVWLKSRSLAEAHQLFDTNRGVYNRIFSNTTGAQSTSTTSLTAFNSDGFSIGSNNISNTSGSTNVSWTFRKAEKFFDVVTFTSDGSSPNQRISHNLGSVPGCIIVKSTTSATNWDVYHRSLTGPAPTNTPLRWRLRLNLTNAQSDIGSNYWGTSLPTATDFGIDAAQISGTCVAYLFAHDAGGFGEAGDQNVISCGSVTVSGGAASVNLGWEPQWILFKQTDSANDWYIYDTMRGWDMTTRRILTANFSDAESSASNDSTYIQPTPTGFRINGFNNAPWVYIAIRRGPMKTPTDATKVFSPITTSSASAGTQRTTGFPVDMQISCERSHASYPDTWVVDRLRGLSTTTTQSGVYVITNGGMAESTTDTITRNFGNTGFQDPGYYAGSSIVWWNFRRAPGFFDAVCYTGTGSATTVTHGLSVTPELILVRRRNATGNWSVYVTSVGATKALSLNSTAIPNTNSVFWNDTAPTSSVFTVGTNTTVNASGGTYVAYLFASVPGVSKVGSYTGNGTSQTINCGFTAGARFILIKRTDVAGDWFVYDSARGIVSGSDPQLKWNGTAAESTSPDAVDPNSSGFIVNTSSSIFPINESGGTYIYLAIA